MKKIFIMLFTFMIIGIAASAQTKHKEEVKSKPKTSVTQKVHNVVRPHHKHYKGHKRKVKVHAKKD